MSGFWIKWEKGLTRKPEILRMAARLMISPTQTAGSLMLVMEWLDDSVKDLSEDGHADVTLGSLPSSFVDSISGIQGFAEALAEVGWVQQNGDVLRFVNVGRHNLTSAKNRALASDRKRAERSRNGHAESVTKTRRLLSVSDSASESAHSESERIYKAYPKKAGHKAAIAQIEAALKIHPADKLLERTNAYAQAVALWPKDELCFVPDPERWFKKGRYEDDPATWIRNSPNGARQPERAPTAEDHRKDPW